MTVITISRQFGSDGDAMARKTAHSLGYHLVGKKFIGAILSQYGLVEFGREYDHLPGFWEKFNAQREQRRDVMVNMLDQVTCAVAQHGNVVIVGRSGFVVLAGLADVLHVRVKAPEAVRVERVRAEMGLTLEQAAARIIDRDQVRENFLTEFYHIPWSETQAFDLVIDTGRIAPGLAAGWVVDAVRALPEKLPLGEPTAHALEVDPVLAKSVCQALKCDKVHGLGVPGWLPADEAAG